MTRHKTSLLSAVALSFAAACSSPPASSEERDERWEEFKASAALLPGRATPAYVFGGDMVAVGEDGLYREYLRYFGGPHGRVGVERAPLTVDSPGGVDVLLALGYGDGDGGRFDLSYCIETGTFSAAELSALKAALASASESWSSLVNVRFRYASAEDPTCGVGNTDVFFNVRGVSAAFFASAFFPGYGRAQRELLVSDSAFTTTAGGRDLDGIMRHELGHVLGFRHEHIWISCTGEGLGDARHVTAYDEDSVMHYPQCRSVTTGGYRQTGLDYKGAIDLYGLAAPVLTASVF